MNSSSPREPNDSHFLYDHVPSHVLPTLSSPRSSFSLNSLTDTFYGDSQPEFNQLMQNTNFSVLFPGESHDEEEDYYRGGSPSVYSTTRPVHPAPPERGAGGVP